MWTSSKKFQNLSNIMGLQRQKVCVWRGGGGGTKNMMQPLLPSHAPHFLRYCYILMIEIQMLGDLFCNL